MSVGLDSLETLLVEREDSVAWVTLNRPDAANSRNQAVREELKATWSVLAADDETSVVVLAAAGDRFFCAGMDLKEAGQSETPGARRDRFKRSRDIDQLAALPQPTIAAINGYALGGGFEMALACDFRVMADSASVGLPEINAGLVPAAGGSQRLPRLIGLARATELIMLGRRLSADEALAYGLVNRVVPLERLRDEASGLAEELAGKSRRGLRYAKELLRKSQELPLQAGIDAEVDVLVTLLADQQATK